MTPTKCDQPRCGRCRFNLTSYPCIRPTYEVQFADAAAEFLAWSGVTPDSAIVDTETGSPPVRPR